jgi:hypothetical protein
MIASYIRDPTVMNDEDEVTRCRPTTGLNDDGRGMTPAIAPGILVAAETA